jgi:predicted secreted protein
MLAKVAVRRGREVLLNAKSIEQTYDRSKGGRKDCRSGKGLLPGVLCLEDQQGLPFH